MENKVFWVDEVATITRVFGYTKAEIIDNLNSKDIVDKITLLNYQQITSNKSFEDSLNAFFKSP